MKALIIALISAAVALITYVFMGHGWRQARREVRPELNGKLPLPARLGRRIGRRGSFLLFLALLDSVYGYALVSANVAALRESPDFYLSLHTWGWIWVGAGLICLSGVLAWHDIMQFTAAALLYGAWAVLYCNAWIEQHLRQGWLSVAVWLSFAVTVMIVAGWPEPRPAREMLASATPPEGHPALPEGP